MTFDEYFNQRYAHVRNELTTKALRSIAEDAWNAARLPVEPVARSLDEIAKETLSKLVLMGASPAGLSLAMQLFGAGACDVCNYRKIHCRCLVENKNDNPNHNNQNR